MPEDNKININGEFDVLQKRLGKGIWSIKEPKILDLMDKIIRKGVQLKSFDINISYGIKTGYDEAFIIDKNTKDVLISEDFNSKDIIKPLVRGKDLKKYKINYNDLYLILTTIGVPINQYPAIKKYLEQHQDRLEKRVDQGKYWWELRPCSYYQDFENEKIMWGNLSIGPNFGYSDYELYTTAPANILTGKNIKYFLAIFNSKIT